MKTIAVSGSTGFIGKNITAHLSGKGYHIRPISRKDLYHPEENLSQILQGCDAVIHLSGAPIIQRWTAKNRKRITDSRVLTTRNLVETILEMENPPSTLLNASAVGIYPVRGRHTEYSDARDGGFLGEVTTAWEREAMRVEGKTRIALMRFGVILGKDGGALPRLLPIFKAGLGGRIGDGYQPFPWMHITDLVRAVEFLLENEKLQGPFNFTAPGLANNRKFTAALGKALHRPAVIPVPPFALRLLYGKAADTLLEGQDAIPERLKEAGFEFKFPDIGDALEDIVK